LSFAENPQYELKLSLANGSIRIYTPVNSSDYHTSRYVECLNQQIYSSSGTTKETLEEVMNEILRRCNKQFEDTFRTDIAALANSILYRLKYPVDQHCSIRMGCILSLLEYDIIENEEVRTISENPYKYELFWQQKKEQIAHDIPDAYAFFLTLGVANTEAYRPISDILSDSDYFSKREAEIRSLLPQNT
jgi:hypothetical protein